MLTTLAATAGEPNVVEKMKVEKKQSIDGVNNLDYRTGKTDKSDRNHIFHYYESNTGDEGKPALSTVPPEGYKCLEGLSSFAICSCYCHPGFMADTIHG